MSSPEEQREIRKERRAKRQQELELQKEQNERNRLEREVKYWEVSKERGEEHWEGWCEEFTNKLLKEEIQFSMQDVNRLMDRSENTVRILLDLKTEAEEQFLRNRFNHLKIIDYLMNLYKMFLEILKSNFAKEQDKMLSEYYQDSLSYERNSIESLNYIENVIRLKNLLSTKKLEETDKKFKNKFEDIKILSIVERDECQEKIDRNNIKLSSEIQEVFENVKIAWSEKKIKSYWKCFRTDEAAQNEFMENEKKIKKQEKTISHMKNQLNLHEYDSMNKMASLKNEKNTCLNVSKKLEDHFTNQNFGTHEKLKYLCFLGNNTKKTLKRLLRKVESVKFLSDISGRYKIQREDFSYFEEGECYDTKILILDLTKKFQMKISIEKLENLILRSTKDSLLKENQKLMQKIEQQKHLKKVQTNMQMLRISPMPTVKIPVQISNHIPQIVNPILNQKQPGKMCACCRKIAHVSQFHLL